MWLWERRGWEWRWVLAWLRQLVLRDCRMARRCAHCPQQQQRRMKRSKREDATPHELSAWKKQTWRRL